MSFNNLFKGTSLNMSGFRRF